MGFLPYVLLVMVPGLVLSVWAAHRVKTTFAKWDKVDSGISMNAFDFARYLLNGQGLNQVTVEPTPGSLTDHYDPRTRTLRISTGVAHTAGRQSSPLGGPLGGGMGRGMGMPMGRGYAYGVSTTAGDQPLNGRLSVAQVAVIAHEVGHAQQHATHDPLMSLRQLVVPVAQIGSTLAPWLVIIGVFMRITNLAVLGLVFFAAAVAFTFITLPVEFGASRRALAFVGPLGLTGERGDGARAVLSAAGWTYVAAALTALLTFLYYLTLVTGSRR
ncbi:MAG TPA: zinc metallopeptidase [Candidatus Limnocylindrales bacterium]